MDMQQTPPTTSAPQAPLATGTPYAKLSWREKFAGIIVLFIGFVYLFVQVSSFLSSKADTFSVNEGDIHISSSELMNHVRSIVSIILALLGGWLLLNGKKAGWVISVPLLLLILTIATWLMIAYYPLADNLSKILGGTVVFLILLALLFLILPSARKKYKVTRITVISMVTLLVLLAAMYFFMQ
ncbi:hypothetical protein [Paraflavitalea pollutisoli]|uniref:hypothetical protein n=1 Tax=Paraflavitalea pollutisoli TaxID=3034143 RepID=UPI0023EAA3FC|nr:hypothetical protein [Paraflavitalea sp. H1-2-19X]